MQYSTLIEQNPTFPDSKTTNLDPQKNVSFCHAPKTFLHITLHTYSHKRAKTSQKDVNLYTFYIFCAILTFT